MSIRNSKGNRKATMVAPGTSVRLACLFISEIAKAKDPSIIPPMNTPAAVCNINSIAAHLAKASQMSRIGAR